ncbi:MAG: MFS transporter [Candidatus Bathyarchaeota archaeon]|nr:MFS transporter [Candidatus Bathyarchaeota archaeon]
MKRVREELGFLRGNLLVLIASYMLFGFTNSLYSPFRSLYIRELGATPFIIGIMDSVGSAILAFIRIPGAFIADKYGRRKVIVIFTFGAALSYGFYLLAWDWRLILVAMIVSSLSHIYQPALEAIEADSLPSDKRGFGYTLIWLLPGIPAFFGPIIAGYLVEKQGMLSGMRFVYGIVFVVSMGIASIRWLFLKETIEIDDQLGSKELVSSMRESFGSIVEAWKGVGRDVKVVTLVYLLMSFEYPLFATYYSLFAFDKVGVTGLEWGVITTVGTVAMMLAGFPSGKLIDSISRKKAMLIGYLISTPTLIAFTMITGYRQMMIANILFQVATVFFFPSLNALRADLIPQEMRGRILGLMGTIRSFALVPAGLIFGFMYELNANYPYYMGVLIELATVYIIVRYLVEPTIKTNV